jgi:hypothetical protein
MNTSPSRTFALALAICSLGACSTRTAIGDLFDAGSGTDHTDGSVGDGTLGHGSGGITGTGGTTGTGGVTGAGGRGQPAGGRTGAGGRSAGEGGTVGGSGGRRDGDTGGQPAGGGNGGTDSTGGRGGAEDACQPVGAPPPQSGAGGRASCTSASYTYPPTGFYGTNILYSGCTPFSDWGPQSEVLEYEIAATVPPGASLRVKITSLAFSSSIPGAGGASGSSPGWAFAGDGDFRASDFDSTTGSQLFMSRLAGDNETRFYLDGTGQARIDFYECDAATPTRSEIISWHL